ncbi:hypothetical protein Pfo_025384 [Paulownia fortunei]|nr:hypothetical protein Pfo_025384 [Paulownia fortunei]
MFNLLGNNQLTLALSNARVYGGTRFLDFPKNAFLITRLFSTRESASFESGIDQPKSFTLSYLINSCGLSREAAISASKKLSIKSPEDSDALLALLRNNGFSDDHLSKMFFHSIGMPPPVFARMVSVYLDILRSNLENCIIPVYNYLKSLLQTDKRVVNAMKRLAPLAFHTLRKQMPINVAILKKCGVRESNISFMVAAQPKCLMMGTNMFAELVNRVIEMGINTSKLTFVQAILVLRSMNKSTWEHKEEVYRRWGWSKCDIHMAFSIHPICMSLSEKNIMSTMEFLVNEMSCQPTAIVRYPIVLCFSLEKRIMPRCRVVRILSLNSSLDFGYKIVVIFQLS